MTVAAWAILLELSALRVRPLGGLGKEGLCDGSWDGGLLSGPSPEEGADRGGSGARRGDRRILGTRHCKQ